MPQFDPTWFQPQLFWLAVLFLVLVILMNWVALPLVSGTIQRRTHVIEQDLERAGKLKAEIDLVIAAREKAIAEARAQAADLLRAARDRMARIASEKQREATATLHEQIRVAEHKIDLAKANALRDVRAAAIDAAQAITARLVNADMGKNDVGDTVDDVIRSRA